MFQITAATRPQGGPLIRSSHSAAWHRMPRGNRGPVPGPDSANSSPDPPNPAAAGKAPVETTPQPGWHPVQVPFSHVAKQWQNAGNNSGFGPPAIGTANPSGPA